MPVGAIACELRHTPGGRRFPKLQTEIDEFRFAVIDLLFRGREAKHFDRHGPGAIRKLWKRVTPTRIRSSDDFLIALRSHYGRAGYRLVCGFYNSALTLKYGARGAKQEEEY